MRALIKSAFILTLAMAPGNGYVLADAPNPVELKGPIAAPGSAPGSVAPTQQAAPGSVAPMQQAAPDAVYTAMPVQTGGATVNDQADANSGLGLAPGAEGTITQDMIMVSPENSKQLVGKPIGELVNSQLKLHIDRSDIVFEKLRGIMITVTNDTNRPVVVDGEQARVLIGGKSVQCVPVSAIQEAIVPHHGLAKEFEDILAHLVPAAVTVGAVPTVRDFAVQRKPVLERYGPDELRRKIEYSRFGRRILWTKQKVQGIVYFAGGDVLAGARLEMPAATLYDSKDSAMLSAP